MNKQEWIKSVAKETGEPETIVASILEAGLEEIYHAMKREEKVSLRDFGTFYVDMRRSGTVFKFNPSAKWKALFGWASSYRGKL